MNHLSTQYLIIFNTERISVAIFDTNLLSRKAISHFITVHKRTPMQQAHVTFNALTTSSRTINQRPKWRPNPIIRTAGL